MFAAAYFYKGSNQLTRLPFNGMQVSRIVWSENTEQKTIRAVRGTKNGKVYTVTADDTHGQAAVKLHRRGMPPEWYTLEDFVPYPDDEGAP